MRFIPYIYFLRIPLLFALLMAVLPITGLNGPHPIVGGFFDVDGWFRVWVVCLAALFEAAAASVITSLVLLYGRDRFFAAQLRPEDLQAKVFGPLRIPKIALGFVIFYALCALALMAGVIISADRTGWPTRVFPAAAAVIAFLALLWAIGKLWWRFGSGATRFFARRLTWTPFGLLRRREGPVEAGKWPFQEPPELLAGHGLALLMMTFFVGFYAMFALGRYFFLLSVERHGSATLILGIPTLASVLILFTLLSWVLGVLAFVLDRYRIPVLLPLVILLAISAQFASSDHFYEVRPLQQATVLTPAQALDTDMAVLVATEGGGIQAAGWATRVLTGLAEQIGEPFVKSVRAVSSVSGGSVSALYFVNAYPNWAPDYAAKAREVFEASVASSLDDVAWGLVYPDFVRSFVPPLFPVRIDRGWAMERAWLRSIGVPFNQSASLGQWREDARQHKRPAVIFNTTLVETGERFLLSSVDIPSADGRRSFHDVPGYEALDVPAITAARLSATFPYVTPVSRAACCPPLSSRYHIADGGFYDNFGISSIAELLQQATATPNASPLKRVLLIQIVRFDPGIRPAAGSHGWFFEALAPPQTLLHVRDAAQYSHNETELQLLTEVLRKRNVELTRLKFLYHDNELRQPLSWHLTKRQIQSIQDSWSWYARDRKSIDQVKAFVAGAQ